MNEEDSEYQVGPSSEGNVGPGVEDDGGSDDGEEEGVGLDALKAFAKQVQRAPSSMAAAPKVVIPKRGEKDFEPLNQTINIQSKMLRESRQALFDALSGIRGSSSKSLSHAMLCPSSPFPQVKIVRGNMFNTMSHTIRPAASPSSLKGKGKATTELLPEEALYLIERGSMMIWVKPDTLSNAEEADEEEDLWKEDIQGFAGTVEMSVMQAFGHFIGQEGLTLEMYQVYASLKRLGYTVHRREQFLPSRFQKQTDVLAPSIPSLRSAPPLFSTFVQSLQSWVSGLLARVLSVIPRRTRKGPREARMVARAETLIGGFVGSTYGALYAKLRILQAGWSYPINLPSPSPPSSRSQTDDNRYDVLKENPYTPFWHVWKPSIKWSRGGWDKGSAAGLVGLPPDFWIGVVDARTTSFPTLEQLADIWPVLPGNTTPYFRPKTARFFPAAPPTFMTRLFRYLHIGSSELEQQQPRTLPPQKNIVMHLKQGDKTLVLAVVDGGNVGWLRFGRGGFEGELMVS